MLLHPFAHVPVSPESCFPWLPERRLQVFGLFRPFYQRDWHPERERGDQFRFPQELRDLPAPHWPNWPLRWPRPGHQLCDGRWPQHSGQHPGVGNICSQLLDAVQNVAVMQVIKAWVFWATVVEAYCDSVLCSSQAEWLVSSSQAGWNPKTWVSVRCCLSWGVGSIVVPVKYDVSWGVGSEGIPAYKQVEILGPEVLRALVRQHLPQVVLKDPEDVSSDVQASYAGQAASEAAKVAGLAPATEAPAALSMKWQEISLKLWRFWSKWRWIGNSCLCWRGRTGSGWGGVHVMFFVSSLEHMPKTRKTDILDAERWYLMHPDASRCKLQFEFVQANAAGVAAVKDALQDAGVASDQVGVWLRCRMGFIMIVSSIKITQWQAYECMWERL